MNLLPTRRVANTLLFAAFCALLVGLLEVGSVIVAYRRGYTVRLSSDYIWMIPAAYLLCFGIVALLLLSFGRWWPRLRSRRLVVGVFTALAAFSIMLSYTRFLYREAMLLLALGLALQAGRMAFRPLAERAFRIVPAGVALMIIVTGVLAGSVRAQQRDFARTARAALPAAPTTSPNVLLIILDTVRARSMGLYDRVKGNTPHLMQLARTATVFDRAMATSPWTLPSHASFFTGHWPHRLSADWQTPLDRTHPTLAETLAGRGFRTAGFVANLLYATRANGIARGFLHYDDYPVSLGQTLLSSALLREIGCSARLRRVIGYHELLNRKTAADITDAFLAWQRTDHERPWLAFLNYYDAHEPFWPPAESDVSPTYRHRCSAATGADAYIDKDELDAPGRRALEASYDAAIGRIDAELGRLFRELEQRGVLDNTVVIVASDHGEQFGEHGLYHHHNSLYQPALHVPLLIRYPPAVPGGIRVGDVVSLRDMPATIMDLVAAESGPFPGTSLARYWTAQDTAPATGSAFAHLERGIVQKPWYPIARGPQMFSVTRSGYHYILNGDGSEELYHLSSDPGERYNLVAEPALDSLLTVARGATQRIIAADAVRRSVR